MEIKSIKEFLNDNNMDSWELKRSVPKYLNYIFYTKGDVTEAFIREYKEFLTYDHWHTIFTHYYISKNFVREIFDFLDSSFNQVLVKDLFDEYVQNKRVKIKFINEIRYVLNTGWRRFIEYENYGQEYGYIYRDSEIIPWSNLFFFHNLNDKYLIKYLLYIPFDELVFIGTRIARSGERNFYKSLFPKIVEHLKEDYNYDL